MLITDPEQVSMLTSKLRETYSLFNVAIRKDEILAKKPVKEMLTR